MGAAGPEAPALLLTPLQGRAQGGAAHLSAHGAVKSAAHCSGAAKADAAHLHLGVVAFIQRFGASLKPMCTFTSVWSMGCLRRRQTQSRLSRLTHRRSRSTQHRSTMPPLPKCGSTGPLCLIMRARQSPRVVQVSGGGALPLCQPRLSTLGPSWRVPAPCHRRVPRRRRRSSGRCSHPRRRCG